VPQGHAKLIEVALCQIGQDLSIDFALAKVWSHIDRDRRPTRPSPNIHGLYRPAGSKDGLIERACPGSVSHNRSGVETGLSPHRPRTSVLFRRERLAAFGHMSGLLARTGSAAPMKSDDPRLPIKGASSGLLTIAECPMVFDRLAVSFHHVVVALRQTLEPAFSFRVALPRIGIRP